jgi:hypothetical protein
MLKAKLASLKEKRVGTVKVEPVAEVKKEIKKTKKK